MSSVKPRPPADIARDGIALFIEYRDVHGYEEQQAMSAAVGEFYDGEPPVRTPEYHVQGLAGCWIYAAESVEGDGQRIVLVEQGRCPMPEHADAADGFPAGVANVD